MKIEVKLTADQILYLQKKLEAVAVIHPQEFLRLKHKDRIESSLLLDCFDKINTKAESISRKPTIFDHKKKYAVSLKYHEAAILERMCNDLRQSEPKETHAHSLALSICLILDKKMQ